MMRGNQRDEASSWVLARLNCLAIPVSAGAHLTSSASTNSAGSRDKFSPGRPI
jgi:hypothetical protein